MRTSLRRPTLVVALAAVIAAAFAPSPAAGAGLGQASPAPGRLDVFFRHDGDGTGTDPNQDSLVQLTRIEGRWQPAFNIGGYVHKESQVSVTSTAPGRLDIAVRWTDNSVRTRTWTESGGWGAWTNLGGPATGGPAITGYGGGKLAVVWRTAGTLESARTNIRSWNSAGGWGAAKELRANSLPDKGYAFTTNADGSFSLVYDHYRGNTTSTFPNLTQSTSPGADPTVDASWNSFGYLTPDPVASLTPVRAVVQRMRTVPSGIGNEWFWGGGSCPSQLCITRRNPNPRPTAPYQRVNSAINMGGDLAASPQTAQPGESTVSNMPAATWSDLRSDVSSPRLDLIFRTSYGCIQTMWKTNPAVEDGYSAEWRVPTYRPDYRCTWPNRTGTIPLFKRMIGADRRDFETAKDDWDTYNANGDGSSGKIGHGGSGALQWYANSVSALKIDQGSDFPTVWAPRNWHPNAWVYRKSTSFNYTDGLHAAPGTSDYFVRGTNGRLLAINYECNDAADVAREAAAGNTVRLGCTQPLLNVTKAEARNYWLRGADGKIAYVDKDASGNVIKPANDFCHGTPPPEHMGILDLMACHLGPPWVGRANYKGVWLDDVIADIANPATAGDIGYVGDFESGVELTNQQVLDRLPFSVTSWENGLLAMLTDLRSGVQQIRDKGLLRAYEGKIVINYKWGAYGFGPSANASMQIPATAAKVIQTADLVELEDGWVDRLVPNNAIPWSFQRRQAFVDQVHALGRYVLEEKTNCLKFFTPRFLDPGVQPTLGYTADCSRDGANNATSHYLSAQYNLANTLLNYKADPSTYLGGDWVGDIPNYWGRAWRGYELDLGAPIGARTTLANGVQQRLYERGRVIVVPPPTDGVANRAYDVSVPVGSRWYGSGSNSLSTVTSGTVTLYPKYGAVLLNP